MPCCPFFLLLQVHDSREMVKLSRLPFQTVKGLFSAPESSAFSVPEAIGCKPESHWLQARKLLVASPEACFELRAAGGLRRPHATFINPPIAIRI